MARSRARRGTITLVLAAILVLVLIGLGVCAAGQVGATHRTIHWLELNRMLECAADNAIEEAFARFRAAPPTGQGLGPASLPVAPDAVAADDAQIEIGPVLIETTRLEPQEDGTALGLLVARVRAAASGGRHPRARQVEVRRYVKVSPDATGQGAIVQVGQIDLYRRVTE